ncbi:MAG: cell division protein FtsQ [Flavobacteriaceae bacterium]|nr:cell division protein FtsQ [Flavobacteriaceae bacterium]
MKKYIIHIKFILLIVLLVFLYGFASHRNANKTKKNIDLVFENGDNLFISYETVNKLLIQNLNSNKNQSKENINLNNLEKFVQSNEMIENAEIFLNINGDLGAIITQRTPVLRVANDSKSYYYDRLGERMILSDNYSARVPISTSEINSNNCKDVIYLANQIKNDEFFKKQIIGLSQIEGDSINQFELKTRIGNQTIIFGDLNRVEEKMKKLKVFYQKMMSDSIMNNYKTINLKFKDQVVCTKI